MPPLLVAAAFSPETLLRPLVDFPHFLPTCSVPPSRSFVPTFRLSFVSSRSLSPPFSVSLTINDRVASSKGRAARNLGKCNRRHAIIVRTSNETRTCNESLLTAPSIRRETKKTMLQFRFLCFFPLFAYQQNRCSCIIVEEYYRSLPTGESKCNPVVVPRESLLYFVERNLLEL